MVAYSTAAINSLGQCACICHRGFIGFNPSDCCWCSCPKIAPSNFLTTIKTECMCKDEVKELKAKLIMLEDRIKKLSQKPSLEDPNENIFEWKQVNIHGLECIRHARNVLHDFHKWIMLNVPENKERSVAVTHLETAAMWLNKSISRRKPDNEKVPR